ncbi:MFS transporter [Cardiobacteriaceae bacterium TAE3-ERU3]|nr:MFS transporter [Cardiobacteriaceae bacterium TAE3-ERU3]
MNQRPYLLFSLAVILLAANLRAPIIAVGPLVETIRSAIDSTPTIMGLIGTLPVLTFAACSPFAAKLARRFGLENTILAGLILIAAGGLLRSLFASEWTIMLGTVILCAGITMGNVLLAAAIKRDQPSRIQRMTALQMFSFSILSALSAALAVPIAKVAGWQWALAVWSLLSIPAFFVWLKIRSQQHQRNLPAQSPANPAFNVWRSALAWKISLYTGLQSMMFYTLVAWLATIIAARGFSETEAGYYNTLFQLIALPTALLISPLSERYSRMDHLLAGASALIFTGIAGVWFAPTSLMWLFTTILGIGGCASFTFCLMLFAMRGETAAQSAALSGMGQTVGYAIAAIGPVAAGWLYETSGGWQIPIYALLIVNALQLTIGWFAGKPEKLAA